MIDLVIGDSNGGFSRCNSLNLTVSEGERLCSAINLVVGKVATLFVEEANVEVGELLKNLEGVPVLDEEKPAVEEENSSDGPYGYFDTESESSY